MAGLYRLHIRGDVLHCGVKVLMPQEFAYIQDAHTSVESHCGGRMSEHMGSDVGGEALVFGSLLYVSDDFLNIGLCGLAVWCPFRAD